MQVFTKAVTDRSVALRGSLTPNRRGPSTPQDGNGKKLPLFEVIDGLPIQRVELLNGRRPGTSFLSRLATYCEENRSEIDIVQFLNLENRGAPWVNRLRHQGIALVYTHTMSHELSANPFRRVWQRFNWRRRYNQVDCIVVSSKVMARQFESLGVSPPVEVIPNGVDLERFQPVENQSQKGNLRKRLGLDRRWQIMTAIGPINPRKGVDVLLKAFARISNSHPDLHLVLVGPRHDLSLRSLTGFHKEIQQTMVNAGIQDRVHFTGAVQNVEDYLRATDLVVFPSRQEGMPNVVPEAMACGLPVIMTPFIGLPEEFGIPGIHYSLSNWDPDTLAAEIDKLLANKVRQLGLGKEARSWVEQNLDLNKSLDQYTRLYSDLAKLSMGLNFQSLNTPRNHGAR